MRPSSSRRKLVLCCIRIENRAGSMLSNMINESQQITQSLTIIADMKKADSQTKKNWWLYEGTACRRQDLGVPFQFACHLRTPTHHLRRAQWTLDGEKSGEKTSTHTSSYSEEVPRSADAEREAATLISWRTFKGRKHWAVLSAVVLRRWSRAARPR